MMELRLRTLTPLHVGDGSTLHTLDYVVHNGKFYRTSQRFFERFLQFMQEEKGVNLYDRFVDWANDLNERISNLENERRRNPRQRDHNQTLSDLRRQLSMHEFAKKAGQEKPFLDFLQQQKTPSLPIFSEDKRIAEIRGFLRDADERVYLPGSSVKGSIRTALLFHFLEKNADDPQIGEMLANSLKKVKDDQREATKRNQRFNPARHIKGFGEQLEHAAFFAGMKDSWGKQRDGEAQADLMKCLLVSDVEVPQDGVGIEKIDLYLVKKLPKGGGYESQRQRQAPAVEAVLPGQSLTVHIDFNLDLLLLLHRKDRAGAGLKTGREIHFMDWRKKVETVFGLTEADFDAVPLKAAKDDPAIKKMREKAFRHILDCCKRFTDAQAEALSRWQKEDFCNPKHQPGGMARDLEQGADAVYRASCTRLHLGFATGFEGMTVVLHLLEHHRKIFADIMEIFGIGDSPMAWRNRKPGEAYLSNPAKFPKSRRMATRPGAIIPMGWLEWADDPDAKRGISHKQKTEAAKPVQPDAPGYLKGQLKTGAEVDAELVRAGNPGKFKLFIREDFTPEVELKYPAGFKEEDLGRLARVRVKNVKGKDEVTVIELIKFF